MGWLFEQLAIGNALRRSLFSRACASMPPRTIVPHEGGGARSASSKTFVTAVNASGHLRIPWRPKVGKTGPQKLTKRGMAGTATLVFNVGEH